MNLETARRSEEAVRKCGAIPATIAILNGVPTIGLSNEQLERFANADGIVKASRRDLGAAIALKHNAATTVSATMALAHEAGIRVFATGGIGGVHRENAFDVSADLTELARTPVLVVCTGVLASSVRSAETSKAFSRWTPPMPPVGIDADAGFVGTKPSSPRPWWPRCGPSMRLRPRDRGGSL